MAKQSQLQLKNGGDRDVARLRAAIQTLERVREENAATIVALRERLVDSKYPERQQARDLAAIRRLVVSGRTGDALHEIDRALSTLDSAWRTYA